MAVARREFLKGMALGSAGCGLAIHSAEGSPPTSSLNDGFGVLVDTTLCVGCRKCEYACGESAGFPVAPIESYDDPAVFEHPRRPAPDAYTVVNRFGVAEGRQAQTFVKINCLHCLEPACASACLVGALKRDATGAITYDAHKCMGCRYCMVACPFQIPTYEYDNAFTPQVRKCNFCAEQIQQEGGVPACVKICPREALIFGQRAELVELAHAKAAEQPTRYQAHIYGETEAGGTRWLYLTRQPHEQLGLLTVGDQPPQRVTEAIQHSLFRSWVPPLGLYGLLGVIMWLFGRRNQRPMDDAPEPAHQPRNAQHKVSTALQLNEGVGAS